MPHTGEQQWDKKGLWISSSGFFSLWKHLVFLNQPYFDNFHLTQSVRGRHVSLLTSPQKSFSAKASLLLTILSVWSVTNVHIVPPLYWVSKSLMKWCFIMSSLYCSVVQKERKCCREFIYNTKHATDDRLKHKVSFCVINMSTKQHESKKLEKLKKNKIKYCNS